MTRSQTNSSTKLLRDAWRFYRRGRYRETLLILQRAVASLRAHFYIDYLSALCMLHLDQYDRAFELITRAAREFPSEIVFSEMMAYLHLKSAVNVDVFTATIVQLGLIDSSFRVRRLFDRASKADADAFAHFQKRTRISECVTRIPPPREPLRLQFIFNGKRKSAAARPRFGRKLLLTIPLSALVISAVAYIVLFKPLSRGSAQSDSLFAEDEAALRRYPVMDIAAAKASYVYTSSERLLQDYSRARKLVKEGDSNEGLILVNRILNSNASVHLRERAAFIKKFVLVQDERKASVIASAELLNNPLLYNGVVVILRGKAVNVRTKNNSTSLELLVGAKANMFECMAEVLFRDKVNIVEGDETELKAIFLHAVKERNVIVVEGISGGGT